MSNSRESIGIIGAMETEVRGVIKLMSNVREESVGCIKFFCGSLFGHNCIVSASGVGKVCSASTTEAMIIKYNPKLILNIGIAGSLNDKIKIHDIVIATSVVQYDLDITALGHLLGFIPTLNIVNIPCSSTVNKKIIQAINKSADSNLYLGVIASGDSFIASTEKKFNLSQKFNAVACDMEGGSIGQVCYMNNVPFSLIRKISDNADDESKVVYTEFESIASQKITNIIEVFFKEFL